MPGVVASRIAARALALALAAFALLCAVLFGILLVTKIGNFSAVVVLALLFYGVSAAVLAKGAILFWRRPWAFTRRR